MKTNVQNGKTIKSLFASAMLSLAALTSQAQSTCNASITNTSVDTAGTATFSSSTNGSMPDYQYVDYGDGTTAMVTPNGVMPHTYTCNGTYQVSFSIGSNDSLCYAYATDSVVITNLQPCGGCNLVANFTATVDANDTTGLTYIFTNTSTGGSGNIFTATPIWANWNFGDGNDTIIPVAQAISHVFPQVGIFNVSLTIYDSACVSITYNDSILVIADSTINGVNTCNLQANFTAMVDSNDTTGLTLIFTNTSTGAHANPTWSNWNFGDGATFNAGASWQSVSHTYTQAGIFNVSLIAADTGFANCIDTLTASFYVFGNGGGNPSGGNTCGSNFFIYQDSSVALTWNVYPNYSSSVTSATWSWGDNAQSTGMYPSHTYATAGTYTICLTTVDSCGTTTYCDSASIYRVSSANAAINVNVININAPTALKTTINKTLVSMYPNPANNKLTVSIAQNDNSVITMYDAIGKQVMQQKATGLSTELNVSNLPQGMYFVNVNGTTQKVVISE
ncbi:MAG: PKD domain-containing protein [Bacteroidia bacterium]